MKRVVFLIGLAACSVEKLPPVRAVHRGDVGSPSRVVVLPSMCLGSPCASAERIVATELAFRGVDVFDLSRIPARERTRHFETTTGPSGETSVLTVTGPMDSDLDMWQQRNALALLGVDGLVRVTTAQTFTWPKHAIALIQITRASDAALIDASSCDLEVSRVDTDATVIEKSVRCAIEGLR